MLVAPCVRALEAQRAEKAPARVPLATSRRSSPDARLALALAAAPTAARWGGLGGVSPPRPERSSRGGGGGGGGGRWEDKPPAREEWRSRAPAPRQERARDEPPAPLFGDEDTQEASASGGWDDDAGDGERGGGGGGYGGGNGGASRSRAGAGRASSYGGGGVPGAGRERRAGGWGAGAREGGGGGGGPERKWQTTRERREADPLAAPTLASTLRGEALYGVAPVRAALAARRRGATHTLFLQESMDMSKRKDAGAVAAIQAAAAAAGAAVRHVDKHELNLLSDNRPHQGVVLDAAPLELLPLRALPPPGEGGEAAPGTPPPVWVALDEVSDPQNFGAVLRSALFLGAAGVVVCARNSAPLSPVVSKASSGAMELLPVHACASMPAFLATSAANGWDVLGADAGPGADDCAAVRVTRPTLLVLGSEGRGLRTNVRRECARLVCVPAAPGAPLGGDGAVDSLNVGVAAGVLLHALLVAARSSATLAP